MLEPRFGSLLPGFLRHRLMIVEAVIDSTLESFGRELARGARVLDAGAGESRYANHFAHCRYTGLDLAIGDCAWDYSKLDAIADLVALPFRDACFDAVINIVVLEHTREPARVLAEMARVLKPGGRLLLVAPQQWEVHQQPHDYFRYTRYGLVWLLEQAGLSSPLVRPIGGYFTLLARRLLNALHFFQGGWRWLFFPVVALVTAPCALVLPALDFLDQEKNFTLAYVCLAEKP